jgi:23S rRNA pseudouridine2605 synthase
MNSDYRKKGPSEQKRKPFNENRGSSSNRTRKDKDQDETQFNFDDPSFWNQIEKELDFEDGISPKESKPDERPSEKRKSEKPEFESRKPRLSEPSDRKREFGNRERNDSPQEPRPFEKASDNRDDRRKPQDSPRGERRSESNRDEHPRKDSRDKGSYENRGQERSGSDRSDRKPARKFDNQQDSRTAKPRFNDKPFESRTGNKRFDGDRRSDSNREERPRQESYERNHYENRGQERPGTDRSDRKPARKFDNQQDSRPANPRFNDRPFESRTGNNRIEKENRFENPYKKRGNDGEDSHGESRPYRNNSRTEGSDRPSYNKQGDAGYQRRDFKEIRLNRFISNAGVCSRRDADDLILKGEIKVNGKVVTELGFKVKLSDAVEYKGKSLDPQKKVYLLLNKPKDTLTTFSDPEGRRTVYEIIKGATPERIYSVGRLDRNTTGLLLFTNNGDMATALTHPANNIKKLYHVVLNKDVTLEDFNKIKSGFELEDGFIAADDVSYANDSMSEIGIEIHSGRNRIVRRMFEHLGYDIVRLDRVVFAGLTKKALPRGEWRMLTSNEVNQLHMLIGKSKELEKKEADEKKAKRPRVSKK